jgi:HD-GYP domain-containing protein (c-di-GMP phosphodiesterase class II)
MTKPLRKIDVDGLRVGMYVSRLDRPWLETPFLFQGFFIRNINEVEDLRRYCDFVEIDLEESDARMVEFLEPPGSSNLQQINASATQGRWRSLWQRFCILFGKKPIEMSRELKPGEFYRDTASIADELVVAKSIHTGALEKYMDVLEGIRNGSTISMPDLEVVTGAMVDSVLRNSTAMAVLVRMQQKDEYTSVHSIASSVWALIFGRHLGLDKESLKAVGLGGLLLDVGKMRIPNELLQKEGKLTDEEMAYIRTHVDIGLQLLREASDVDRRVLDMVATHHERYDGSGYPRGSKGNQIPVFGRIGGIVDSYSAMTRDRPYARAMSSYDIMREFKALSDKHFQAEMVEQFIQALGIFPVGTLVELNTGEVGIVLREHQSTRLQPELAIILDSQKRPLKDFETIDLSKQGEPAPTVWIERGVEPGAYDIDPREFFL